MKKKAKRTQSKELVKAQATAPADPFIAMIERAARDPAVDINKMKELLAMRDKERAQVAREAYATAMSLAQSEMEPVRRDCENKQTHSRYASYYALDAAIRPIYVKHGFALSYNTEPTSAVDMQRVTCDVSHKAGHTTHHQFDIPIVTTGPQGKDVMTKTHATMSANTYGMRGLLRMIFNIATMDDDGNAAGIGEKISDEQLVELGALVEQTKANVPVLCEMLGVDVLANLPKSRFLEARAALIAKQKQQQKKVSGAA